ncbi:MAG: hypothetical protein KOO62_07150 [candidate division Zixibacteria bacterium]|nr:hypothetical protein [candidate division Zixibacteria bacterium]
MKKWRVVLGLILVISLTTSAMAQFEQDPNDAGAADTVEMVFSVIPDYTTGQYNVQMDLWVFNDANLLIGATSGFTWDNANLQMDSATASDLTDNAFDIGPFFYEDADIDLTNSNQRFLFGGALLFASGVASAPESQIWASYYFTLSDWDICDSIALDSLTYSPGSDFGLVGQGNHIYQPYWKGRIVAYDTACIPSANLVLSTDLLSFDAVEGASSPDPQSFTVSSDGVPLFINISETIPWLAISPSSGWTTQVISVLPNTIGMSTGTYLDSIRVESALGGNSPQYLKVELVIESPPPEIGATPTVFYFNAVAGEDDPDPKILTITNEGGPTLNWTVSNSESWLSLTPGAGTDAGDVTVSVNITGLSYDDYVDTIVITDPMASNDPVKVPVFLSVGSDLPIIEVDSAFNYIVVPTAKMAVDPRTILIRNAGAGTMNFWLEESSVRLFTVTPSSGTASQEVEVGFKLTSGSAGDIYDDTLWVYSNEAINSPFPVVFQFHLLDNPAYMYVTSDTVYLELYECTMGAGNVPPISMFTVDNVGGEDPMGFDLTWESDLFSVTALFPNAPTGVMIQANYLNLPVGTYLDTIVIYAQTSLIQWDTVIVRYDVIEPTETPEIWLTGYDFVIPAKENSGPVPPIGMGVDNVHGGCMDWYVIENVPWMYPTDTAGTVPSSFSIGSNADGFVFGEYPDSFFVHSDEAANSPQRVDVLFRVWRFHGDMDYSCEINILDLTYMVSYLFLGGPGPIPTYFVGNLNCDHTVDILDLTYFVSYLFSGGPMPCGNPY